MVSLRFGILCSQICSDFSELFEGVLEILFSEHENIEASPIAVDEFLVVRATTLQRTTPQSAHPLRQSVMLDIFIAYRVMLFLSVTP
jgi:hypothetical protein